MADKILIDADPGLGDAIAIIYAMLHPDVEVVALTACAGTVSGLQATRNAQSIVEILDPSRYPRIGRSQEDEPVGDVEFASRSITRVEMNGPHGLGDLEPNVADLHNRRDSAKVIVDLVRDAPHEITLVTLGPLTNVARAFELAPDLPEMIKGLVCLGGSVEHGGDITAAAEFNIWSAPDAARMVLRSTTSKLLVPLDISTRAVLSPEHLNRFTGDSPRAKSVSSMLQFSLRAHRQHFGIEGVRMDEVTAIAAAIAPELFESRPMAIDVETYGDLTRGATVFDRRGIRKWQTNINVLTGIDYRGVIDLFDGLSERL